MVKESARFVFGGQSQLSPPLTNLCSIIMVCTLSYSHWSYRLLLYTLTSA